MPAPGQERTMHPLPPEGSITYWPALIVVASLVAAIGTVVFVPLVPVALLVIAVCIVLWVRQTHRQDWEVESIGGVDDDAVWWQARSKNFWGTLGFIFTSWWFFSAAIRAGMEHGLFDPPALPPPLQDLNGPIPIATTLLLVASIATAYWSTRTLHPGGHRERLPVALALTGALGILFLLLRAWDVWRIHDAGLTLSMPIGSVFYWLMFLHSFAVLLGILILAVILWRATSGHFRAGAAGPVRAVALYWVYTVLLWLLLYATLYLKLITYDTRLLAG